MSLRRLIAMAYKETLQIWRDPRSLAIALLMPMMQMALLGYGVSLDIRHVPLCVHDEERSQASRELVERFVASGWFSAVRLAGSERDVRAALDRRECSGVVTIPVDFSRTLARTGNATVQTVFDASDTNTTNIATGYAQGVIAQTTADFGTRWAQAHGLQPQTFGAVDIESRVWYNEGLDSRNFIIPGVVAVILALVGAQLTSLTVAREWERGTMEQLISTPVKPLEVMFGKLAPYFAIGFANAAFCLLVTVYWFGVPFRGSVLTLLAITALFTLVVLGIGYLMSVRIRSQLGASQIALLLTMMPTTMLSGYTFAIEQMPKPVQAVTFLVYARYYVTMLRAVFLKGSPLADIGWPFAALALYAAVIVWLSVRAFRKHLD
ncbi:ABC transporter permease [Paraburkholderia caballeronis]|uniref:ABC-2 type transport system permease protein n=1 Tax=Paraburkholderia caballeronis TaxID=416943 RepID=A0A1H7P766_9BURK|nr:ABC transporter permease [Paraburkholderia caballeronis]PXW25350.1 ABC-2 type transport system permease protein [Paraburkholderia caballeronis]PXX00957.1 ABC-2 type transport system permease protein [Paraburkholderia caballeronis]RAJ99690.1 ABC-2 type transport system permease protein [Paraburkholderia caballeronis]TDV03069.1 ABC-2 type transport system permease protein [Paraburkholderia caballeronis]TDV08391.1 ABC-2 type transport system permease protein [Paraburkholderia caballeronis]